VEKATARLQDLQQSVHSEVLQVLNDDSPDDAGADANEGDGDDGPDLMEQAQELSVLGEALQEMNGVLLEAAEKRAAALQQAEKLRAAREQQRDEVHGMLQQSASENEALRQQLAELLYAKQKLQNVGAGGPDKA
jgi:hypothetical protein